MRVTLILVNFQSSEDTLKCLASALAIDPRSLSVIVVDNGSDEAERIILEDGLARFPDVKLINLRENKGYAAGCNAGIRYALDSLDPGYIWLLNNDTILDPNALASLIYAARNHPGVRIWGSTIRSITPPHPLECSGGYRYLPLFSIPIPIIKDPEKFNIQEMVTNSGMAYVSGVSMFVKASIFSKQLMDESYFLYYEELELVRLAGGRQHIAWCPQSVVFHSGGASTGGADPNRGRGSWAAHYYGNRSALKYTWKYYKLYFPFTFVFRFLAKTVVFVFTGEWQGFGPMVKGYSDFLRGSGSGKVKM